MERSLTATSGPHSLQQSTSSVIRLSRGGGREFAEVERFVLDAQIVVVARLVEDRRDAGEVDVALVDRTFIFAYFQPMGRCFSRSAAG